MYLPNAPINAALLCMLCSESLNPARWHQHTHLAGKDIEATSQRLIAPPKAAQTGAGGAVVGSRCSVSISRSTPCPWVSKLETQNGLDVFVKGEHLRVERL